MSMELSSVVLAMNDTEDIGFDYAEIWLKVYYIRDFHTDTYFVSIHLNCINDSIQMHTNKYFFGTLRIDKKVP